jgi:hypothetical protein
VGISLERTRDLLRVRPDAMHFQSLRLNPIRNAIEAIETSKAVDRRNVLRTAVRATHNIEVSVEYMGVHRGAAAGKRLVRASGKPRIAARQ